jgi:hypothetical protein
MGRGSFGTTHARCAREVERNVSNLMAHLPPPRSSTDRRPISRSRSGPERLDMATNSADHFAHHGRPINLPQCLSMTIASTSLPNPSRLLASQNDPFISWAKAWLMLST